MENSPAQSDLQALRELIRLYERPSTERDAQETLLLVAKMIALVEEHTHIDARRALDRVPDEVNAVVDALRSHFEGGIGHCIGSLRTVRLKEIRAEIAEHRRRIDIIENAADASAAYDALVETGWSTGMSRDEWTRDGEHIKSAKSVEKFCIRPLEYELEQLEVLFTSFVRQTGSLGPKAAK